MSFSLALPCWSIGPDAYKEVYQYTRTFGKKAAVIGGKTAMSKAYPRLKAALEGTDIELTEPIWYLRSPSYENAAVLAEMPEVKDADMIFGIGGGKAVDCCKIVAGNTGKPLFTFPTLASNCAASTSISVTYDNNGKYVDVYYGESCPKHCFIDTDIIADSPYELLWAGIGDTLAKEYEVEFSTRAEEKNHVLTMGDTLTPACTKPLFKYSKKALEQIKAKKCGNELQEAALDIIVTSAIVSCMCTGTNEDGSNYFYISSSAHAFYDGTTAVPREKEHLHGEQVSFGILVLMVLDGQLDKVRPFLEFQHSVGLPVCLADMDLTVDDVDAITELAATTTEYVATPYKVSKEAYAKAVVEADRLGREYLASLQG